MTLGNIPFDILKSLNLLSELRRDASVYTDDPSAPILAPEQMARGSKKIRKKLGVEAELVKKTLIITDWSFAFQEKGSDEKAGHFIDHNIRPDLKLLETLLEDGFLIFICRNGQLVPIQHISELRPALATIRPIHHDRVVEYVEKYNREQAEQAKPELGKFEILDYAGLRHLLHQVENFPNHFKECDHRNHRVKNHIGLDQSYIHLDPDAIDIEYLQKTSPELLQEILQSMQGHPRIGINLLGIDVYHIERYVAVLDQFLSALSGQMKTFTFRDASYFAFLNKYLTELHSLESLDLSVMASVKLLHTLSNLRNLSLLGEGANTVFKTDFIKTLKPFNHLCYLNVASGYATTENFVAFLKLFPQLKTLQLNAVTIEGKSLQAGDLPSSIENLSLRCSGIQNLGNIFPNLRTVKIEGIGQVVGYLPKLKQATLVLTRSDQVVNILNGCPYLEELEIEGSDLSNWALNTLKQHAHLKKLRIKNCYKVDLATIVSLTERLPALETLELEDSIEIIGNPEDFTNKPKQHNLREIKLKNNGPQALALLPLFPAVESMQLESDKSHFKAKLTGNFPQLKRFKMKLKESRSIESSFNCPEVESLELEELFSLENAALQKLQKLSIDQPGETLINFLNLCPALSELHIDFLLGSISQKEIAQLKTLSNLNALTVSNCLRAEDFEILLHFIDKAPNLQTIQITNCRLPRDIFLKQFSELKKRLNQRGGNLALSLISQHDPLRPDNKPEFKFDLHQHITGAKPVKLTHLTIDPEFIETSKERPLSKALDSCGGTTALKDVQTVIFPAKHNSYFPRVLHDFIYTLFLYCPNVRSFTFNKVSFCQIIRIYDTTKLEELIITESEVDRIALRNSLRCRGFEYLSYLHLSSCKGITSQDIAEIKEEFPHLKIYFNPHPAMQGIANRSEAKYGAGFGEMGNSKGSNNYGGDSKQSPSKNYNGQNPSSSDDRHKQPLSTPQVDPQKPHTYNPEDKENVSLTAHLFYHKDENEFPPQMLYRKNFYVDYKITAAGFELVSVKPSIHPLNISQTSELEKEYTEKYKGKVNSDLPRSHTSFGEGQFLLSEKWVAIPGLSPNDVLLGFEASLALPPLQLGMCYETRQYFVRLPGHLVGKPPVPVHLKTIMRSTWDALAPKHLADNLPPNWGVKPNETKPPLMIALKRSPDEQKIIATGYKKFLFGHTSYSNVTVEDLIAFCDQEKFSPEMFSYDAKDIQIKSLVERLCDRKSCEDRSMLFLILAKHFGFNNVRIQLNDSHAEPEVLLQGRGWLTTILGGIRGQVTEAAVQSAKLTNQTAATISIPSLPHGVYFHKKLKTSVEELKDAQHYCQQVLANFAAYQDKLNLLLKFNNPEDILHFKCEMAAYLENKGKNWFYLPDFEHFKKTETKSGEEKDNQLPSEVVNFLRHAKPGDVLMVDWSDYQEEDLGFNTMMDDKRHIKGIPIPDGVIVISTIDKNKAKKLKEDFYSRCRFIDEFPSALKFTQDIFNNQCVEEKSVIPGLSGISEEKTISAKPTTIQLYNDEHWQENLLGKVDIHGKMVLVTEGPLIAALRQNKPYVVLRNAPWHRKDFCTFLSDALQKGQFTYFGKTHKIPKDFKIYYSNPPFSLEGHYTLERLNDNNHKDWQYVLNALTFDQFFRTYTITSEFNTEAGLFAQHAASKPPSEMVILVSQNFSMEQWARFCHEMQRHNLNVRLILAEGVRVPHTMSSKIQLSSNVTRKKQVIELKLNLDEKEAKATTSPFPQTLAVIPTNDMEFTTERLCAVYGYENVISVGPKTTYNDLLDYFNVHQDKSGAYCFERTITTVLQKLKTGETVLIKGQISPELSLGLETLLADKPFLMVNGKKEFISGKLVLITTHSPSLKKEYAAEGFKSISCIEHHHSFTPDHYWQTLEKQFGPVLCQPIKNENPQGSYFQLKNKLNLLLLATQEQKTTAMPENKAENEIAQRARSLAAAIQRSPCVQILGDTGVGKSYLVFEELQKFLPVGSEVLPGFANLAAWAKPSTHGAIKVLFIDEANLEMEDFSILEGLFNKPPGIWVNGTFQASTGEHRVVFAGNFAHYLARIQHRIFDFCETLVLEALKTETLQMLTAQTLKEALPNDFSEVDRNQVVAIFWELYEKCRNSAKDNAEGATNASLTLRNLQTMALRFAMFWHRYQKSLGTDINQIAWMAAYEEVRYSLRSEVKKPVKKLMLNNVDQYKLRKQMLNKQVCEQEHKVSHFLLTKKRRTPFRMIVDHMAMRELRAEKKLSFSGVRGILLEGPPGNGKSAMAEEALRQLGYEDITAQVMEEAGIMAPKDEEVKNKKLAALSTRMAENKKSTGTVEEKSKPEIKASIKRLKQNAGGKPSIVPRKFVRITPADPEELKQVLEICFQKGYVVIIDELNVMPCEKILNYYMSGRGLEGKKPEKEGFFVIATQNPSVTHERKQQSVAQKNRFQSYPVNEYTDTELDEFITRPISQESIVGYKWSKLAAQTGLGLTPTFRDLRASPEDFEKIAQTAREEQSVQLPVATV